MERALCGRHLLGAIGLLAVEQTDKETDALAGGED